MDNARRLILAVALLATACGSRVTNETGDASIAPPIDGAADSLTLGACGAQADGCALVDTRGFVMHRVDQKRKCIDRTAGIPRCEDDCRLGTSCWIRVATGEVFVGDCDPPRWEGFCDCTYETKSELRSYPPCP